MIIKRIICRDFPVSKKILKISIAFLFIQKHSNSHIACSKLYILIKDILPQGLHSKQLLLTVNHRVLALQWSWCKYWLSAIRFVREILVLKQGRYLLHCTEIIIYSNENGDKLDNTHPEIKQVFQFIMIQLKFMGQTFSLFKEVKIVVDKLKVLGICFLFELF